MAPDSLRPISNSPGQFRCRADVPDNEVVILVVDECRDPTIWVVLDMLRTLVLARSDIDGLIRQTQHVESDGDFPVRGGLEAHTQLIMNVGYSPAVGGYDGREECELLSVRHGVLAGMRM